MLPSPNQTANQIRRSYKNDQSSIFVTISLVMKVNSDFGYNGTNNVFFFDVPPTWPT